MILAFLQPLQNVLYMGILTIPSRIYIVRNYNRLKDFEAMKAGKLNIPPCLVCQYNENTLMDLLSSVIQGTNSFM